MPPLLALVLIGAWRHASFGAQWLRLHLLHHLLSIVLIAVPAFHDEPMPCLFLIVPTSTEQLFGRLQF